VSEHEKQRINIENERLGKALRSLYSKHMPINKNYGGVVGDATRVVRYYEGYAHQRIEGEDYSGAASQVIKGYNPSIYISYMLCNGACEFNFLAIDVRQHTKYELFYKLCFLLLLLLLYCSYTSVDEMGESNPHLS
jgi:hypothetical protein